MTHCEDEWLVVEMAWLNVDMAWFIFGCGVAHWEDALLIVNVA